MNPTENIEKRFCYKYPRPALTVDVIVFGCDDDGLQVLLIRRANEPFKGNWAFPGGFVEVGEPVEASACRELEEETGMKGLFMEQLYTFGDPDRDPREHVVTVVYYTLADIRGHRIKAASDASEAAWFPTLKLPPLAFDHLRIMEVALERLRKEIRYRPIAFRLLPPEFTLKQLHRVYETVLEQEPDERGFPGRNLAAGLLIETGRTGPGGFAGTEPMYRVDKKKYACLEPNKF